MSTDVPRLRLVWSRDLVVQPKPQINALAATPEEMEAAEKALRKLREANAKV